MFFFIFMEKCRSQEEVVIDESAAAVMEEKAVVEEKKVEIAPVAGTTVEDIPAPDNQEEVDKW